MTTKIPQTRSVWRRTAGPPPYRLEQHNETIPDPLPPTSILLRIHAVSLNYRDANMLHGTNPWPVLERGIPCSDAAGEVVAVGAHAARFRVGDRVCPILDQASVTGEEQRRVWLAADVEGVLASHCVVEEQLVVEVPRHLGWVEAACLPCAGMTAWAALVNESRRVVAGQTVVVTGTGGVSMMALKLALAAGCKVIVTSSSDEKLAQLKQRFGQDRPLHTVNYKTTPAWAEEVVRINGGVGADILLENAGAAGTMQSLKAVKKGGIISQVGYLDDQNPKHLDGLIPLLIDKAVNFRGINVGSRLDFERMNELIAATGMRFEDVVDRKFSYDEAPDAFEYLWSGKHVGKVAMEMQ